MYNRFELGGGGLEDRSERDLLSFPLVARALKGDRSSIYATEARRPMIIGLGHDARVAHVITIIMSEVHATIVAEPSYIMLRADLVGPVVPPLLEAGRIESL